MESGQPPPEAGVIAAARKALVPGMSQRKAAELAGISPTRWRQLEAGVIRVRGEDYPERAPAETLARMALVVGVTAADLLDVGRGDAAVLMEALARAYPTWRGQEEEAVRAIRAIEWLSREEQDDLIREYRRKRSQRHAGPEIRAG